MTHLVMLLFRIATQMQSGHTDPIGLAMTSSEARTRRFLVTMTAGSRRSTKAPRPRSRSAAALVIWVALTCLVAAVMLLAVLGIAALSRGYVHKIGEGPPFVSGGLRDVLLILGRNALALALFSLIAVILTRSVAGRRGDRGPAAERLAQLVGFGLLACVLLGQVYLQGHKLGGISGYLQVPAWRLLVSVLPHALLELTALLLPLTAAALMLHRRTPRGSPRRIRVAAYVAVPLLVVAAGLEVYVSPRAYQALACTQVPEDRLAANGSCGPEPCPTMSPKEFERRYQIKVPADLIDSYRGRCTWPRTPHTSRRNPRR